MTVSHNMTNGTREIIYFSGLIKHNGYAPTNICATGLCIPLFPKAIADAGGKQCYIPRVLFTWMRHQLLRTKKADRYGRKSCDLSAWSWAWVIRNHLTGKMQAEI